MSTYAARTRIIGIATVVAVAIGLRLTRDATLPIVAGAFIAALVHPVRERAARIIPRPLALLVTVVLVVAITAAIFGALGWSADRIGGRLVERRDRLEQVHAEVSAAVSAVGLRLPPLPGSDTEGGSGEVRRIGRAVFSGFAALGLTLGFMALGLAETRSAARRVRLRFDPGRAERIIGITDEVAHTMRRYLAVKSLTSAITGVATFLLTLAFGLDFALTWGLIAFLLEYVPTIGSVLAVIPPALYALVQFDGFARPLALIGALTLLQLFLGNYVDPKIEGRLLSLSPFVVLASIVVWAWIWGAPGALLGVPLTIAATTVARHFDSSRWIWALLTEADRDSG